MVANNEAYSGLATRLMPAYGNQASGTRIGARDVSCQIIASRVRGARSTAGGRGRTWRKVRRDPISWIVLDMPLRATGLCSLGQFAIKAAM
jgi:hypothetical protein